MGAYLSIFGVWGVWKRVCKHVNDCIGECAHDFQKRRFIRGVVQGEVERRRVLECAWGNGHELVYVVMGSKHGQVYEKSPPVY